MKTQTGIWLDSDKALLVHLKEGEASIEKIESEVEHYHPKGGYGSSNKQLGQDAVSESAYRERKDQQLKRYYHKVMDQVAASDELLICGPGEVKVWFNKELENTKSFDQNKIRAVESADSMTENQLVAYVKDYFTAG